MDAVDADLRLISSIFVEFVLHLLLGGL